MARPYRYLMVDQCIRVCLYVPHLFFFFKGARVIWFQPGQYMSDREKDIICLFDSGLFFHHRNLWVSTYFFFWTSTQEFYLDTSFLHSFFWIGLFLSWLFFSQNSLVGRLVCYLMYVKLSQTYVLIERHIWAETHRRVEIFVHDTWCVKLFICDNISV